MLQRQVYRGGPAPVPGGGDPGVAMNAELRMDRIETQMRELTGRVEEFMNQLDRLRQRLEQGNGDPETRVSQMPPGSGGYAAGGPPPRPRGSTGPGREYPDPGAGLRLHLNENTGGCSPRVIEAIRQLKPTDISTYPSYASLVLAVAKYFDVDPEWVLLTNGLDEGILMAAIGHISRQRIHDAETIIPTPAFDPYPNSTAAAGAASIRVPANADLSFPTDAVIKAVTPRTRMIFLNTPNNPTGQLISIADLARIAEAAPDAIVLIDEAYIEFGGESFLPHVARLHFQYTVEMQSGLDARAGLMLAAIFPAEPIHHRNEAAPARKVDHVADAHDGILQMSGDDLQILVVLGEELQSTHSLNRSISAPQALSFSSIRSNPRSR